MCTNHPLSAMYLVSNKLSEPARVKGTLTTFICAVCAQIQTVGLHDSLSNFYFHQRLLYWCKPDSPTSKLPCFSSIVDSSHNWLFHLQFPFLCSTQIDFLQNCSEGGSSDCHLLFIFFTLYCSLSSLFPPTLCQMHLLKVNFTSVLVTR